MKKTAFVLSFAIYALLFAACGSISNENTANSNAAVVPPLPSKEELIALDAGAFEAFKKKDVKFFEDFLAEGYLTLDAEGRRDKAATIKAIAESSCVAKSLSVSDEQVTSLGAEAVLLTYKAMGNFACDGEEETSRVWAATVFVRADKTWKSAYHNEVPIADPNSSPSTESADIESSSQAKPESNPNDSLTDALLAVETRAWEAWKNKETSTLDDVTSSNLTLIDGFGRFDKAGALKKWSEQNCEIKSISLSDAKTAPLDANAALLTYFAAVEGQCDGMPAAPVWGTTVYVKEGEQWKAVLLLETAI